MKLEKLQRIETHDQLSQSLPKINALIDRVNWLTRIAKLEMIENEPRNNCRIPRKDHEEVG
jgi:hypothetical protein